MRKPVGCKKPAKASSKHLRVLEQSTFGPMYGGYGLLFLLLADRVSQKISLPTQRTHNQEEELEATQEEWVATAVVGTVEWAATEEVMVVWEEVLRLQRLLLLLLFELMILLQLSLLLPLELMILQIY